MFCDATQFSVYEPIHSSTTQRNICDCPRPSLVDKMAPAGVSIIYNFYNLLKVIRMHTRYEVYTGVAYY